MEEKAFDSDMGQSGREKYWKELSIEGKIERMRQQIKLSQYQETDTRETVMRLNENFSRHKHVDGQISVCLDVANSRPMQYSPGKRISANPDEVYF